MFGRMRAPLPFEINGPKPGMLSIESGGADDLDMLGNTADPEDENSLERELAHELNEVCILRHAMNHKVLRTAR